MSTAVIIMALISALVAGFSFISSAACINHNEQSSCDPMSLYWLSAIAFALLSLVCFSTIAGLMTGTLYWLVASLFSTLLAYGYSFIKQLNHGKSILSTK